MTLSKMVLARKLSLNRDVTAFAWSPDGRLLAVAEGLTTVIEVWNVESGQRVTKIEKQPASTQRILFSPDGKHLIIPPLAPYNGVARTALVLADVHTGQVTHNIDGPNDPSHFALANQPADFALSPDGKRLYVTFNTQDQTVHIYDTSTWTISGSIPASGYVMAGGPGDDELTTTEPDGTARVWDARSGSLVQKFVMTKNCHAIALAPAACLIASGAGFNGETLNRATGVLESNFDARPVRIWNIRSGKLLGEGSAVQLIRRLAFNPSATLLAAATGNNSIVLFNTNDLAAPRVLAHFQNNAPDVAFSPDGKYFAAAGDAEILLYKVP